MRYEFNPEIAIKYGLDISIFLTNFSSCSSTPTLDLKNDSHIHDDYCCTYNRLKGLEIIFPFWSLRQIKNIIRKCIDNNLLIIGTYNRSKFENTKWYKKTFKAKRLLLDKEIK